MEKYRLSRLFIPSTVAALVLLLLYYCLKFYRHYRHGTLDFAYGFNFPALAILIIATIGVLLLLHRSKMNSTGVLVPVFIILSAVVLFAFDFSLPTEWGDGLANIRVVTETQGTGCADFLKDYHTRDLMRIKQDPSRYDRFMESTHKLGLDYQPLFDKLKFDESQNIAASRTALNPPLWFCVLKLWRKGFGGSYLSYRILDKIVAILFIMSFYALLGLLLKNVTVKQRLAILFLFVLTPMFLTRAVFPKNDLAMGIFGTWTLFFMFKNRSTSIRIHDVLVGLAYSIAVLFKLTSLTLIVPIGIYYLVEFKLRAVPKFAVMLVCFAALPVLLYAAYGYDLVLNVFTAQVSQAEAELQLTMTQYIGIIVVYGQYHIGIPLVLLLLTHLAKARHFLSRNSAVIAYSFLAFFYAYFAILYGSHAYKSLPAYFPLTAPMLACIYSSTSEKRKMTFSTGLLLLVNVLLMLANKYMILNDTSTTEIRHLIVG